MLPPRLIATDRLALVMMLLLVGCGPRRPDWMIPPSIDPTAVTRAAMSIADKDRNGMLENDELAVIPALRASLKELDADGDKKLSFPEIEAWLSAVGNENAAFYEACLTVSRSGRPVANARVTLVPESCMGSQIEPAEGETDETGLVFLNIVGGKTFGVRGGLYRVQITGKAGDGQPLPPKFNSATILGLAVGGGLPQPRTPEFRLD